MLAEQQPHSEPVYLVNALESAWNEHDLGAVSDLFDDGAVLLVEPAIEHAAGEARYEGLDAIRDLLRLHVPGGSFATRGLEVESHRAAWEFEIASDRLRAIGLPSIAGRANARVWNGRFQELELALSPETAAKLRAAQARGPR